MEGVKRIQEFLDPGPGHGDGYDSGSGYGYGYDSGDGIKAIAGEIVYRIDDVQTILKKIHGNVAKGKILMADLTTRPCYIVKQNGLFAHGETLREAMDALAKKTV